jgi:hypothetical protein
MAAGLGNVLYWLSCALAAVIAAIGAFVWFNRTEPGDEGTVIILVALAAIVWLFGRVCHYVLAKAFKLR